MIEPYRSPGFPAPLGDLVLAAALGLFILLQQITFRLRAEEGRAWWASNGRDVVNAVAAVSLTAAVWLQGLALPLAIFFGCTITLALTVIGSFLHGRMHRSWRLLALVAAVLGAPLVIAPRAAAEASVALLQAITPGWGPEAELSRPTP